jgi:hypothetical protein
MESDWQRRDPTPIASDDQSEPTPRPTTASEVEEDDSDAETERLESTPRKANAATDTSSAEGLYTRTLRKLMHSRTGEDDASAPPTPSVVTDDETLSLNKDVRKAYRLTKLGYQRREAEVAARSKDHPPPRQGTVSITAPPGSSRLGSTSSRMAEGYYEFYTGGMSQGHGEHIAGNGLQGVNATNIPSTRRQRYTVRFAANLSSVHTPLVPRSTPSPSPPTSSLPSVADLIASSSPRHSTPSLSGDDKRVSLPSNNVLKRKAEQDLAFESNKMLKDEDNLATIHYVGPVNSRRQDSAIAHVRPGAERRDEDSLVDGDARAQLEPLPAFPNSSDAVRGLCSQPRHVVYRNDMDQMASIRSVVLEESIIISNTTYYANADTEIRAEWDILAFVRSQYSSIPSVASIVVLIGSSLCGQATTCGEYVRTHWPSTGPIFLDLLDQALTLHLGEGATIVSRLLVPGCVKAAEFEDCSPSIHMCIEDRCIIVSVCAASERVLVELAQLLAWAGSALSNSPFGEDLAYGTPSIHPMPWPARGSSDNHPAERGFHITFEHEPLHVSETSCWLPLFSGMIIASGFPIASRGDEIGLETSLELLAAFAGVSHVTRFEGGLVMKGFCSLMVPVQKTSDRLQWHVVTNQDSETYLSYHDGLSRCKSRLSIEQVGVQDLKSTRAFLGWCSVYTSRLGSKEVDYDNIDYSGATEASDSIRFNGAQVGFQQWATATANFSIGAKQTKHYIGREGPFRNVISAAERTPVLLYDTCERRGYLVSATDVMLHMIQHRHRLEPFEVNGKKVVLETGVPIDSTAKEILKANHNLSLSDDGSYTFKHAVHSIWSILEDLRAKTVTKNQDAQGIAIENPLSRPLHGYEFKAIVQERGDYTLMEKELSRNHGGWPLLVRDINALVLLANGFGDLILPSDEHKARLCNVWQRLPSGCDYLVATCNVLTDLYDVAGSRASRKYLTTTHLQWHQGQSKLFELCKNTESCECNRLQQIVSKSDTVVCPDIGDVQAGAVIFGNCNSLLQKLTSPLRLKAAPKPPFYHHANAILTPTENHQREETVSSRPSSKPDPTATTVLLSLEVGPCTIYPASERPPKEVASEVTLRRDSKRPLRLDSACSTIEEDRNNYDCCEQLPSLKRKKAFRAGSAT